MPTLYGSTSCVQLLAAATEFSIRYAPFTNGDHVMGNAVAGATLYAMPRMAMTVPKTGNPDGIGLRNGVGRYVRIIADGVKTTWTSAEIAELANLHDDAGTLAVADKLLTVVTVNGRIQPRKQSDATLAGGDFLISEAAGVLTLEAEKVGTGAYGAGTVLDVFMDPDGDFLTTQTLTANTPKDVICGDFMLATAATTLASEGY